MTDRTIVLCVSGLSNVRVLDLSGNHQITQAGWKSFADHLRWGCLNDVRMMWVWCENDMRIEDDVRMIWGWCEKDVRMMWGWYEGMIYKNIMFQVTRRQKPSVPVGLSELPARYWWPDWGAVCSAIFFSQQTRSQKVRRHGRGSGEVYQGKAE